MEIGGYFELELNKGEEYHKNAIRLNTGRNALELILKTRSYSKVFIPFYTCKSILEPFKKLNIEYEFYSIDKNLEPKFDYLNIKDNEGFIYTNYFGIKDTFINKLASLCNNLIIDNSQSFFSKPTPFIPTFYSCRKFFGVPDGAYLYLEGISEFDFPLDHSENRIVHLLKKIEYGAEAGYNDFKSNDTKFIGQPILQMSKLTKALLCNIDYKTVQSRRKENFLFLHHQLSNQNEIQIEYNHEVTPMVYPFVSEKIDLKQKLIDNKIFVATYWQNVIGWCDESQLEYILTKQLIPLPIDQRYDKKNMERITNGINLY